MVYIDSAILGPDRKLKVNSAYDDLAQFGIIGLRDKPLGTITVTPAELAEALNGIVPGFTAFYEKPVVVPQGVGSVVESVTGRRIARFDDNAQQPNPWSDWAGIGHSDVEIQNVLRSGGKVIVDNPKSSE